MPSYASDLRAAAEAEREAADAPRTTTPALQVSRAVRLTNARNTRLILTTPDRLLHLLDRLEQLERVAEAARATDHSECENFPPGSRLACTQEPPEGWGITINPCLFCALRALDREAR